MLTYNIHHGEGTDGRFDLSRLAGVVTSMHPDLVALQEVDEGTERASGRPRLRVDYVLIRPATRWRVIESSIVDDAVASDHRPLLVVLEWTGSR